MHIHINAYRLYALLFCYVVVSDITKGLNVLLSSCIISYINLQVASQVSGINLAFRFLFCPQFTVLTPQSFTIKKVLLMSFQTTCIYKLFILSISFGFLAFRKPQAFFKKPFTCILIIK